MTDNSNPTLPAAGVGVRAIDRPNEATTPPAAASGITQVVQLDVAGATGPESLVSDLNPLPTQDAGVQAAQSSDGALGVFITGDPNGDFAGVNIIEQLVDDGSGLAMNVKIIQPPFKVDANGAMILSDCFPVVLRLQVGAVAFIDTQGYQSFSIQGTANLLVSSTNDFLAFTAPAIQPVSGATQQGTTGSYLATAVYVGACQARYLRITGSTGGGQATIYLRSGPAVFPLPNSNLWIAGNAGSISNFAGSLAVGGGVASGTIASGSTHPVIAAGVDQAVSTAGASAPVVRRMLTDSSGRLVTAPLEDKGIQQTLASPGPTPGRQQGAAQITTIYNNTAANVQDTTQIDGLSIIELFAQILLELRIANQQRYELPQVLTTAMNIAMQNGTIVPAALSNPTWDEPAAYRAEQSIFNQ